MLLHRSSQSGGEQADKILVVNFRAVPQQNRLEIRRLEQAQRNRAPSKERRSAPRKVAHELRQIKNGIQFQRDRHQNLRAAPVLFRLLKISRQFERYRNLRGQRAGPSNILVADLTGGYPVQHAKHADNVAIRPEQRHGQKLLDLKCPHEFHLRSGSRASIFRQKYIFLSELANRHAFMQRDINRLSPAVLKSPANMEGIALEQPDETALKAEETRSAHH